MRIRVSVAGSDWWLEQEKRTPRLLEQAGRVSDVDV